MINTLISGAFGNVGISTVEACLAAGDTVTVFEADTRRTRKLAGQLPHRWKGLGSTPRIEFGDVHDPELARRLVEGQDAVLHLAAIIPPAADRDPELAHSVNVGETANLIAACRRLPTPARFVFASSVAAYGDRVQDYWIKTGDALRPRGCSARRDCRSSSSA
jgi:nucleoside-diphosphate-sugar epimerase